MSAFVTRVVLRLCMLTIGLFLATGCGPEVTSETPDGVSFAGYKTIGYGGTKAPPPNYKRATLEPEARKAALDAAKETLAAKGWVEVAPEEADVVVYAALGQRTATESYASVTGQNYDVLVEKGTIVLDAYDRRTQKPIWKGQVEGTIRPPIDDLLALRKAVEALLNEFPAPGASNP